MRRQHSRDEAGCFCILDKFAYITGGRIASLGTRDRLLDRHEAAGEHARARQLFRFDDEARPDADERVELTGDEHIVRTESAGTGHELRVLETAAEKKFIC